MLKTPLLHPQILSAIAKAGHHAKILIADGNYPASTKKGPNAELVSLQLTPGVPTVAQVLAPLLKALPIDHIHTMGIDPGDPYALTDDPAVWTTYRSILKQSGFAGDLEPIMKWDFYDAVMSPDHVLTIQTADQATWANLLLLVGVRS
ncbi:MAG: RbsD/FucU family protein [Pirellulaceae bacterium]|nr:RbsD/FucU family protein [Pirellulaceae bacterium]